jgi:maltose alpha-D-glucosyltransferase/alpha-amylase
MHSLLFSLPGAPVLYYGDEIGMGDDVSLPDRNGVRTPMQWADEQHAGFSNTMSDALYAPVLRDPIYGFQKVNVDAQRADEGSLLHAIRRMIAKRKELPLLAKGKLEWMMDTTKGTLCFWRGEGDQRMASLNNICSDPHTIPFPEHADFVDAFDPDAEISEYITLPPHGYRWLVPKSAE